ncbi:MAG TPA: organomercurial lyase [Sedimentisphaerales bacterium]|nr:organomercurial lyase [Sedimentisphaerales bacterium]
MSKIGKLIIVVVVVVAAALVFVLKNRNSSPAAEPEHAPRGQTPAVKPSQAKVLPRLVDLGATKCIPCKMMAPILEELKTEYAGRLRVDFIDVWQNPDAAKEYGIKIIPTQIFFDAAGKDRFRHEGFFSKEDILAKWKELGVNLAGPVADFSRLEPAMPDNRPKEKVCYMCDGDIDAKTLVVVKTEKGDVRLCSPHCYFIMYSCLTEDKTDFESKVMVTDWVSGNPVAMTKAGFLCGRNAKDGRPWIRPFDDASAAEQAKHTFGGNIVALDALLQMELSGRCGFCDRACYPQDAARVLADGIQTWGCCSHCALGVAARTGKDIEVHERDRLTGEPIIAKTFNGSIASIEPATAVAWFGQRKKPDGSWGSAGCFHQGFFVNADNLIKWVEQNPRETGRLISIRQALADKMKLSQEQIRKACKIGECAPK